MSFGESVFSTGYIKKTIRQTYMSELIRLIHRETDTRRL
jgi:hypothetical protein